jgi:hypothetical protein
MKKWYKNMIQRHDMKHDTKTWYEDMIRKHDTKTWYERTWWVMYQELFW